MTVIAKRNTKRIIKGHRYEADKVTLSGGIVIKGMGFFLLKSFTDINGNDIVPHDWTSTTYATPIRSRVQFSEFRKGDILVCNSKSYKTFIIGKMYKISDLKSKIVTFNSWNGTKRTRNEDFIKFSGINRWIKFNSWSFRKLNTEEARELALNNLLFNEEMGIITSTSIRGIDVIDNKEKELIRILAKSMLDKNRHHLSVVEWACSKIAPNLKINPSDFEPYLDLTLTNIFEKLDN